MISNLSVPEECLSEYECFWILVPGLTGTKMSASDEVSCYDISSIITHKTGPKNLAVQHNSFERYFVSLQVICQTQDLFRDKLRVQITFVVFLDRTLEFHSVSF